MPQLQETRIDKIDGDHQRVKDYDQRNAQSKKKFTHFYTKQELEEKKAQTPEKPLIKVEHLESKQPNESSINQIKAIRKRSFIQDEQKAAKPLSVTESPSQLNQKTLVKPKNEGQFDQNQVMFSYLDGSQKKHKDQLKKDQSRHKNNTQDEDVIDGEVVNMKKVTKKSKKHILEVPEYFTQDELLRQFGAKQKETIKQHEERDYQISNKFMEFFGNQEEMERDYEINKQPFSNVKYDPKGDQLLEDMWLKNQFSTGESKKNKGDILKGNTTLGSETTAFSQQTAGSKYTRLPNGMIINNDIEEAKRQNDMLAKINVYIAKNKAKNGQLQMPFGMIDSKSMAEFYTDLFTYAPCILKDAVHTGDEFERFKLSVKFAFSILHNLTFQDVFQKKPLMPILGETYEGHYIYQDVINIQMESDYVEFEYIDRLTLKDIVVKKENATTYINIEGPKGQYSIFGHLTYDSKWKGNNLVIALPGILKIKFYDQEGDDQEIEIQLPEYVLANYFYIGKKSMILINGPMVVVDKKNNLKCVVLFHGLQKETQLFGNTYNPNTKLDMKVVQGIIYKYNSKKVEQFIQSGKTFSVSTLKDLYDVQYKLERIFGNAIDYYEIEEIPQSNWKFLDIAEPIPCELALPSDIRFREDLIWMKRGEKGKGKVWKGMMKDQFVKDFSQLQKKSNRMEIRKKPKRVY